MKKYKIHFSIFNLFNDTQAEVAKLQQLFKGLSAAITAGTWYNSEAKYALYVAIGGAVVDTLISCLYFEKTEG